MAIAIAKRMGGKVFVVRVGGTRLGFQQRDGHSGSHVAEKQKEVTRAASLMQPRPARHSTQLRQHVQYPSGQTVFLKQKK